MHQKRISRAQFLAEAAALGVAGAAAPGLLAGSARADEVATGGRGLTYRGVGYEVTDGETPFTGWTAARMRRDIRAIACDLHANTVSVFGDGVERLAATASTAVDNGLHVWMQPRLGDVPRADILDHLAEAGRAAEALRRQGARIVLSVGAEFVLFVPGIVPGADVFERIRNLLDGNFDPVRMQQRLTRFIGQAAAVGRSVFRGRLTYGAAFDDEVDWGLFDIVCANYYSYFRNPANYVRELQPYLRYGKPVTISEFGSCTYVGAPQAGGMAWDVVDFTADPQYIIGDLQRSEQVQSDYIISLLDVFESMNLYAATVYDFVTPDAPHRSNPRYDLDLACYAIVKSIWSTRDDPTANWHWEPKVAFNALARRFAAAA